MANLCDRLQHLKSEKNVLQKEIAKAINISLRSYQRYESGERKPDSDVLIKLSNYFDVSVDYLLGLSDNQKHQ